MKCIGYDKRRSGMKCEQNMYIIDSSVESALDSTDVYSIQKHACTNENCTNYVGKDKENTQFIKETRTKIN